MKIMRSYVVIGSIINVFVCLVACHEYKGFDDSILFKINWPGNDEKVLVSLCFVLNGILVV